MSGVFSPTRAKIKERTLRTDKWWLQPLLTFSVLISFVIYATFRAFENDNYYKDHLISPFYSPCLSEACVPEATINGFTPNLMQYAVPLPQELVNAATLSQSIDFRIDYYDYTGKQSEYVTYLDDIKLNLKSEIVSNTCQTERLKFSYNSNF